MTNAENKHSGHPFDMAGYPGPWTYMGAVEKVHTIPGGRSKPGGTCDVCGTCYRYGARFRDSRGALFVTGCDCAAKTLSTYGDMDTYGDIVSAKRIMVRKTRRDAAKAKRDAAKATRAAALVRLETEIRSRDLTPLEPLAHPQEWAERKGLTWADAVRWHIDRGNFKRAADLATEGLAAANAESPRLRLVIPKAHDSRHVGVVGTRLKLAGTIVGVYSYHSEFGPVYIVKIVTTDGDMIGWKTACPFGLIPRDPEEKTLGLRLCFVGRVKSHEADKYADGAPVTWMTRVVLSD